MITYQLYCHSRNVRLSGQLGTGKPSAWLEAEANPRILSAVDQTFHERVLRPLQWREDSVAQVCIERISHRLELFLWY